MTKRCWQNILLSITLFAPTEWIPFSIIDSAHAATVVEGSGRENFDRAVDQAALSSQEQAISKLKGLLKKYAGRSQEPNLLLKLGELQQQHASILFRIAHGTAHRSQKSLDLTAFKTSMNQAISTFNTVISKYPHFPEIHEALYARGKGYEEIENKELATRDYLHLVKDFPDVDQVIPAYMSLAEFSIDANNHPRAISYLNEVEKHPESPWYPFALQKQAWSHYNIKEIKKALEYAERQISYYNNLGANGSTENITTEMTNGPTSDSALKENMLLDVPVFYFQGYEDGNSSFGLAEALPYFRKLDSGPLLGRMFLRFAKLLRSHSHESDLLKWKDQVMLTESDRAESLDVLLTAYEYQLNRRLYPALVESTQDMVRLYKKHKAFEAFPKAQKMVLETATGLQESIVKNKDRDKESVQSMSRTLAALYDGFTKIVDESDPRIPRVHYNLAETLFVIKDFDGATEHYRWVVRNGKWELPKIAKKTTDKPGNEFSVVDASLKAIASRYEVLRQKLLVPQELTAQPLSRDASDKALDPLLDEWVAWLDKHIDLSRKDTDSFYFEAARSLYVKDHIKEAVKRLAKLAKIDPNGKYAIPAASLILDTYIASMDWEKTTDVAEDFSEVKEWKGTDFSKRLFVVASDSFYKRIEIASRANDFKTTVKLADKFLKKYAKSDRLSDTLLLGGQASTKLQDPEKATEYFTRLIKEVPGSSGLGTALIARAGIYETGYDLPHAAADYRAWLALPAKLTKVDEAKLDAYRRKTLLLTWLSADYADLKTSLSNKVLCSESLEAECERYSILIKINETEKAAGEDSAENAFEKAHKDKKDNAPLSALYSTLALEGSKHLSFRDRNHVLRHLANGYEELDPLVKFYIAPSIMQTIPKAVQQNRMAMKEVAPLKADERFITRRVEVIRELENVVAKLMKLPWARVRAEVMNEMAQVYLDLSRGLSNLPPPKNLSTSDQAAYDETIRKLTLPFEEKGQELRSKAFEIASRYSIEEDSFNAIAEPFFAENPSQAKQLKPKTTWDPPRPMDLEFLIDIDAGGSWKALRKTTQYTGDDLELKIKSHWLKALKDRQWHQAAYFVQEMKDKKIMSAGSLDLVQAVFFASMGARGEAISSLEIAKNVLDGDAKIRVLMSLVRHSVRACSRDQTLAYIKEIPADKLTLDQKSVFASANAYTIQKTR